MWKYEVSNTDHTLMRGVELINRLLLGEPEATIGIKYESTLDGRNAATHERSHLAGSGDPKRAGQSGIAASVPITPIKVKTNPDAYLTARPGVNALAKDVGDKAYLVMKHHGKPEHYSTITDLINQHGLDKRTAYKETVHNKLIKDKRFVLVGRGMYALAEWGYKPGVVSDIIVDVLKEADKPLSREEIIDAVLERRLVKKNTIIVGLCNKKLFKKVGKNQYALAEKK
jgi:hypothetical protein